MEEETAFDENSLFANFDSTNENDAPSAEIKMLRKHLGTDTKEEVEKIPEETDGETSQKKYISELEQQNIKLKAIIKRMLGPQSFSIDDNQSADDDNEIDLIKKLDDNIQSKPFAIVLFLNNEMSTVHRKEVDEMMQCLSEKDIQKDVLLAQKLQAQNSAVPLKAFSANWKGRRYNLPKRTDADDPYIICACQYYKSFYVDRMGAPLLECNPDTTDIWNIPTYEQIYLKALPIVDENSNVSVKQMRRCFNCDGDHNLNECTEPKDQAKINKNLQQFSASKMNTNDDELDERYKHFKPGEISVALEEALDISLKTQLPPYIYKMRVIGYPPAYLKPTEEGLKMYGPDGETLGDADTEEGEIQGAKLPDVISYAGYNGAIPEGVRDDSKKLGLPPFCPEEADLYIAMKRAQALGYIEGGEPLAKRLNYDNMDMDMEIEDPSEKPPSRLKPPPLTNKDKDKSGSKRSNNAEKDHVNSKESEVKDKSSKDDVKSSKKGKVSVEIDETTYRNWYIHTPLTSIGITYVMYTPPPTCQTEINLQDLPKNPVTDFDREPWKTASISWYDPLYGDLAAPTGCYDAIRTLLKDTRRVKRKPMI